METPPGPAHTVHSICRRDVLKAGLAAGAMLSLWLPPDPHPRGVPKPSPPNAAVSCAGEGMTRCTLTRIRPRVSRRTCH